MSSLFKILDVLRVPSFLETVWHILTGVSRLTEQEKNAAISVLGADSISYAKVRVSQGRILHIVFKFNGNRAFTTFHTINLTKSGGHTRAHLDIVVHELVHVFQYERVGSVYIWQAIRAQRTDGYSYGGWRKLIKDRENGSHFRSYNREQQGQIAQDYYNKVIVPDLPAQDQIRQAYEPFIEELRDGEL